MANNQNTCSANLQGCTPDDTRLVVDPYIEGRFHEEVLVMLCSSCERELGCDFA